MPERFLTGRVCVINGIISILARRNVVCIHFQNDDFDRQALQAGRQQLTGQAIAYDDYVIGMPDCFFFQFVGAPGTEQFGQRIEGSFPGREVRGLVDHQGCKEHTDDPRVEERGDRGRVDHAFLARHLKKNESEFAELGQPDPG